MVIVSMYLWEQAKGPLSHTLIMGVGGKGVFNRGSYNFIPKKIPTSEFA